MFCKHEKVKKFADIIIGFGILFLGLSTMSSSMAGMKEAPEVVDMIGSLRNPIMATLVGLILTTVIQSSYRQYCFTFGKSGSPVPHHSALYHSGL